MKYSPLWDYLERQTGAELELDFATIERLIGAPLPATAEQGWWWGNADKSDAGSLQKKAWRKAWQTAGFEAVLIRGAQTVKFSRVAAADATHGHQP